MSGRTAKATSASRQSITSITTMIPTATTSELEALVIRALHHLDVYHDSLRAADGSTMEGQTHLAHTVVEHG